MLIRVSAACIARVEIDDAFLLGLNKGAVKRGQRVITPLGGAFHVEPAGQSFLQSLGASFEGQADDLRFTIDSAELPRFAAWFRTRIDRETSPLRELEEELVEEYRIDLPWRAPGTTYRRLATTRGGASRRIGAAAHPTVRYLEVFDVQFDAQWLAALCHRCELPSPDLFLVTGEQMLTWKQPDLELAETSLLVVD